MTRLMRPVALVVLLVSLTLPVAADQAKSWFEKGQDAEARQNYEKAYDDYKQAYDLKPKDLRYRSSFERLKFLAGASHVHRGKLLREAGKLEEALAEFQKAAEIDPSSFIAQQEIRQTQKMIEAAKAPAPRSEAAPPGMLEKRLNEAQGPVELAPIANLPITLMVTNDTKQIYETVGQLAGINVLFDPEYTSRRIRIELNGVTLQDALQIIALESKTFWRPVTSNTVFVAADNQQKRKEVEQSVIRTFYPSNPVPAHRNAGRGQHAPSDSRYPEGPGAAGRRRHRGAGNAGPVGASREGDRRSRQGQAGSHRGCGDPAGEPG